MSLSLWYQVAIFLSIYITGSIFQTSNVIYRVGLLILLELVGSFIILILGQNFLGLTYIIVYIGALAILFLFVIMMLKPNHIDSLPPYLSYSLLAIYILIVSNNLFVPTSGFIITPSWTNSFIELTDIEAMGFMIYVSYPILLIYVAISLLLVLIGIVTILGYKN